MRQKPNLKRIAIYSAVPLLFIGWAAFRPELLFVNQTVNEADLKQQSGNTLLASGSFSSYAHETEGKAEVLRSKSGTFLQLTGFKTSNGPDVHVLLVKGTDASKVTEGAYLDLGSIKGNQGTQNYMLPSDFNLTDYQAVTIWCKRFSVGFGGATLTVDKMSSKAELKSERTWRIETSGRPIYGFAQTIGYQQNSEILVTRGKFSPASALRGTAKLVERSGKRYLRIERAKATGSSEVYLVKKESLAAGTELASVEKTKLGTLASGMKSAEFEVSKDLDVWLYRSVAITAPGSTKVSGFVNLRSDQELKRNDLLIA